MRPIKGISALVWLMLVSSGRAEIVEIAATEIVTIQPADRSSAARVLVKWDLPKDLKEKIVDGAAIALKLEMEGSEPLAVEVMPVTAQWSASSVEWSPGWSTAGGDYCDSLRVPAIVDASRGSKLEVDVYGVVLEQLAGERLNYGFIIVPDTASETTLKPVSPDDAVKRAAATLIIAFREPL